MDWNHYKKNTYKKITHWFKVIKDVLQDPNILPKNVYNMDKTGVMLSIPGTIKVLISKHNKRDYRDVQVKRTIMTTIEYISSDSRYLNPIVI